MTIKNGAHTTAEILTILPGMVEIYVCIIFFEKLDGVVTVLCIFLITFVCLLSKPFFYVVLVGSLHPFGFLVHRGSLGAYWLDNFRVVRPFAG